MELCLKFVDIIGKLTRKAISDVEKKFLSAVMQGRIINRVVLGPVGIFGQTNYSAAKAGPIRLTKTVAKEYASKR